ncbi:hypothetical protein VNO80_18273 [Phaseolus coccineus]|uniref:Uncharacterized protein n=1 Tax=Phaseolus coccineus TaxID=3886 RepID=A0AAN9MIV2_PHACN
MLQEQPSFLGMIFSRMMKYWWPLVVSLSPTFLEKVVLAMCTKEFYRVESKLRFFNGYVQQLHGSEDDIKMYCRGGEYLLRMDNEN